MRLVGVRPHIAIVLGGMGEAIVAVAHALMHPLLGVAGHIAIPHTTAHWTVEATRLRVPVHPLVTVSWRNEVFCLLCKVDNLWGSAGRMNTRVRPHPAVLLRNRR